MFLDLTKFIEEKDIKKIDEYMNTIDVKKIFTETFGYKNDENFIKKDLGKGCPLTKINKDMVEYIYRHNNHNYKYSDITSYGYSSQTKFPFIWEKTEYWYKLSKLSNFIESLPFFEYLTRVVIIYTPPNTSGIEHVDQSDKDRVDEFIWIRTNDNKKFYIKDLNGVKHYVNTNIIWFDTRFRHNSSETDKPSFSIRIDGKFKSYFRKYIAKRGNFRYSPYEKILLRQ